MDTSDDSEIAAEQLRPSGQRKRCRELESDELHEGKITLLATHARVRLEEIG